MNAGERVHEELRTLLNRINLNDLEPGINISKKDFMGLRDLLSKYLKKNSKTLKIIGFENQKQIKDTTSVFFEFITDRNIYTHGQLGYNVKKQTFCIKFYNGRKDDYADVNIEILSSFLEISQVLLNFLEAVRKQIFN